MLPSVVFTLLNDATRAALRPEPVRIARWLQAASSSALQQPRPSVTTAAPGGGGGGQPVLGAARNLALAEALDRRQLHLARTPLGTGVNGGAKMPHARRPGGPVAAAQKCATYGPLSVLARGGGMYGVELYAAVRLAVVDEGLSHHEAGRRFGIDRRTVKKMLSYAAPPGYRRTKPVRRPKLDGFTGIVDAILEADTDPDVPRKQRHTAHRIFRASAGRARVFRRLHDREGLCPFPAASRPARGSLLWATGTSYRRSPWCNFTPPRRHIFSPPLSVCILRRNIYLVVI